MNSLNKLENLPEVTDRALFGLRADDALKQRILAAAVHQEGSSSGAVKPLRSFRKPLRLVPAVLSAVAVMLLCVFLLNGKSPLLPEGDKNLIHSFSAGGDAGSVSFASFAAEDPLVLEAVELLSAGRVEDAAFVSHCIDALKNQSEPVSSDASLPLNDRLNLFDRNGLLCSLPVSAPYVGWADGVRRCDSFFALFAARGS